jgi:hypothetical protein
MLSCDAKALLSLVRLYRQPAALGPLQRALALPRERFVAAVQECRRAGLLTAQALEGRHGNTAEQVASAIREDGALLGYLSERE